MCIFVASSSNPQTEVPSEGGRKWKRGRVVEWLCAKEVHVCEWRGTPLSLFTLGALPLQPTSWSGPLSTPAPPLPSPPDQRMDSSSLKRRQWGLRKATFQKRDKWWAGSLQLVSWTKVLGVTIGGNPLFLCVFSFRLHEDQWEQKLGWRRLLDATAKTRTSQKSRRESDKTETGAAGVGLRRQEEDRVKVLRDTLTSYRKDIADIEDQRGNSPDSHLCSARRSNLLLPLPSSPFPLLWHGPPAGPDPCLSGLPAGHRNRLRTPTAPRAARPLQLHLRSPRGGALPSLTGLPGHQHPPEGLPAWGRA